MLLLGGYSEGAPEAKAVHVEVRLRGEKGGSGGTNWWPWYIPLWRKGQQTVAARFPDMHPPPSSSPGDWSCSGPE
jgi:hypothetical protein